MQELDIEEFVVSDLVLRRTLLVDRTSTSRLATDLGIHPTIVHAIFEDLRDKRYLDVHGLEGNDYRFSLTSEGRAQANLRYERCAYAGIAPVSLDRYTAVVAMQKANVKVNTPLIKKAFADLVLEDRMFDQIGPAFRAQQSAFFYGPTGTGKTSICERLTRLYTDAIAIPYAVEVDGQIITVFDRSPSSPMVSIPVGSRVIARW
jgi:ABC-type multidrug transport system fused ATPase/permease subunit